MSKVRLATVWLDGCSGCHMSFLDLDEFLIELAGKVDLVFSPVIDVKEYPENVDVCLVEGAVCNEDNLEVIRKVRARTKVLISFGDCAVTANVPAIRNQLGLGNNESVLQRAYTSSSSTVPRGPRGRCAEETRAAADGRGRPDGGEWQGRLRAPFSFALWQVVEKRHEDPQGLKRAGC